MSDCEQDPPATASYRTVVLTSWDRRMTDSVLFLHIFGSGWIVQILNSRPTGFSVFSVVRGFAHFHHHGDTENTEKALIHSQIRTLLFSATTARQ